MVDWVWKTRKTPAGGWKFFDSVWLFEYGLFFNRENRSDTKTLMENFNGNQPPCLGGRKTVPFYKQ